LFEIDHITAPRNDQHGAFRGFCLDLQENDHVASVVDTFKDRSRDRTLFGMLVSWFRLTRSTKATTDAITYSLWDSSNSLESTGSCSMLQCLLPKQVLAPVSVLFPLLTRPRA
jgi:hypothetical protein